MPTETAVTAKEIREDSLSEISDGMSKQNDRLNQLINRLSMLQGLISGPRVNEDVTGKDIQKSAGQSFIMVAKTKINRGCDLMNQAENIVEEIIASAE